MTKPTEQPMTPTPTPSLEYAIETLHYQGRALADILDHDPVSSVRVTKLESNIASLERAIAILTREQEERS